MAEILDIVRQYDVKKSSKAHPDNPDSSEDSVTVLRETLNERVREDGRWKSCLSEQSRHRLSVF